jgi:hypothetical protein
MRAFEETTMTLASIGRVVRSATAVAPLLLCLAAAPAEAQLARTFVSNAGNDLNDCNRFTPCRTFQRAHDNTLPLGEITVLDPGGYGAVTINRAISIINDGVGEAGALVSGGAVGVTVNAGATDAVSLRGLTIKGIGFGGGSGIVFNSGGSLTVENCAIRSVENNGLDLGRAILFRPNASSHLAVLDTIITDNQLDGIRIRPAGSGAVTASLSRLDLINNGNGLALQTGFNSSTATINAVLADSVVGRNGNGIDVLTLATVHPTASLIVTRSIVSHNETGIQSQEPNARVRIGASALTGNTNHTWRTASFGVVQSYGDNEIDGNGDGDPAPPAIPKK